MSGLVTFGSGGVAAPQGNADRHPHHVLDATMDTAVFVPWNAVLLMCQPRRGRAAAIAPVLH
jgi:hypothetical protein